MSLEAMLQDIFKAEGLSDWQGLASRAMIDVRLQERNERIYRMKGHGATNKEIADAIGISDRQVRSITKHIMLIKRKG